MKTFNSEINICYACDNKYAPYLGVAILSVIQSHPNDKIHFYVLDNGISEKNKIKLRAMMPTCYQLDIIPVSDDLFESYHIPKRTHFTPAIFYRIKIPELLGHLERVLYLDVDTLVRGNLRPFYDMEMGDNCFAMVPDIDEEKHCKRLHLNYYFNSGVMLFDIKNCLKKGILNKLLNAVQSYQELLLPDQDIISLVSQKEIMSVQPKYNLQIPAHSLEKILKIKENLKDVVVLHYIGGEKPWSIQGNPFEIFYFQIWEKSLWRKELRLLFLKRYRRFLFAQVKMDGVKTNYILGIPVMRRMRKDGNKTVWILGIKVLEKKLKIEYVKDEGIH